MGFFYICFFHNRSGLRKNIYIFSSANSFLIWNLAGGNCFTRRFLYKSSDANIWSEMLATRGPQIINFHRRRKIFFIHKCLRSDKNSKFSYFFENKRITVSSWYVINVCRMYESFSFFVRKIWNIKWETINIWWRNIDANKYIWKIYYNASHT